MLAAVSTTEIVARIPDEADTATRLLAALAGRELLLVLDNCEHLVDAAAQLVQTLLGASRACGSSPPAGSRSRVPGEVLHPVDALADDDAVRLFAERGAAVRARVRRDAPRCGRPSSRSAGASTGSRCRSSWPPPGCARWLPRRSAAASTTGSGCSPPAPRTALPRHQTLRAVVDWSWDLLDEPERALARRLSVFAGGATEEAALRVCGLGDATLDLLDALVEKSLLVAVPGDPTRYRMLETIREYAAQRLDEAGERPAVEAAHAALVVELVETAEPRLRRAEQLEWVARLRAEADDVAAVLRRAVAAGDAATAQRLVAGSAWFWLIRGLFTRGDGPARGRRRARRARHRWRSGALCTAYRAMVAAGAGDFAAASALLADARTARGGAAGRAGTRFCCSWVPIAAGFGRGDPGPLERLAADPQADPWARAFALFSLRAVRGERGRPRPAAGRHACRARDCSPRSATAGGWG